MKDFKKYYIIRATPEDIYKALTTEITIRLWTGDLVEIDPQEGGEFSMWDGAITGKFITLEPFKRIVQQWYFGDQNEPSIVTIKLHEHKKGTSFEVQHVNIPDEAYADIVDGWDNTYMASLEEFYDEED
ncbi:SRPBCC domain-containing protein [Sphingobacterium deserti]|uniref:Activator of HSP90 ATPase 1 family protein n=1 Tax=Sphingobacterium deserti TaxID=1229276 RepID=A0A0B8T7D6_9SPHI|nr:SRPBCC domain-containing protein [Sphingobacterium deserti]KGE14359.1 activator of HSP90 ATPase 1 family protein [Sphingobacterium deserti]